jgi:hypothetical protein
MTMQTVIPAQATGDFAPAEWQELSATLRAHEPALRELAAARRLRLRANSRWPELRLQRRSLLMTHEVRVSLSPQGALAPRAWAVRVVRHPRFPPVLAHRASSTDVAMLSEAQLRQGDPLLREIRRALALLDQPASG